MFISYSSMKAVFRVILSVFLFVGSVNTMAQNDLDKQGSTKKQPQRIHSSKLLREKLSLSIGSYFSHGEYNVDKTTEIFSVPLRIGYSRDEWSVSAQMPYLHISGPARVIAVSDGAEVIETKAEGNRQRWGNGDLRLNVQYQLPIFFKSKARAHIGSTIKAPIASEKDDLGSGEFDYSVFSGGYLRFGRWVSNGRIGYQFMGDTQETQYNNRWYASLGGYYLFNRAYSMGLSTYFKQAATETSESIRTVSTYLNWRLPKGWRCNFSIGTGFSESSADLFGGFQVTKSFVRKRRIAASH